MKLKKFIASIVATALVGTTMAITSAIGASAVPETYTAALNATVGNTEGWYKNGTAPTCTINGDGDYSLTLSLIEPTESVSGSGALILEIPDINIWDFVPDGSTLADTGIVVSVTAVKVDGNPIAYTGPSEGAYRTGDDGNCIRLNIYNVWGNDVQDIDFNFTAEKNVTVDFNVSGLSAAIQKANGGGEEETTTAASDDTTKADDTTKKDDTTKADGTTKKGDTTTKKDETTKSNGDGTTVAQEETTTATGDAGIAGIVLVCALTGAGVVASRKKD